MSNNIPKGWLDTFFEPAFVIDDQGVGRLLVTETTTFSEDGSSFEIRGKYGERSTPNSTVIQVELPWVADDGAMWALDAIITAKGTGISRRFKISAVINGIAGVATLDGSTDVDTKGTGSATADIVVDGTTAAMALELTPGSSTPLTWGFEVRGQRS